jgi:lipoprotein-anchoring transpeptidase ErfK/SrfK
MTTKTALQCDVVDTKALPRKVFMKTWSEISLLALCLFALNSCFGPPPEPPKAERIMYEWHDTGGPGEISVQIDLSEQIATIKRGKTEVGWTYVATGIEGRGTRPGLYRVSEMLVDKHSNKYGWVEDELGVMVNDDATPKTPLKPGERYMPAPMPYWMRLTDYGIGMHAGNIPSPGEPASHGCIRMPKDFVPLLYGVVKLGTPVKIVY